LADGLTRLSGFVKTNLNSILMKLPFRLLTLIAFTFVYLAGHAQGAAGISSFEKDSVLIDDAPVVIADYKAFKSASSQVTITWTTTRELENDFFTLERSSNGKDFTTISIIRGLNKLQKYVQVDEEPLATDNYYRLSQTGKDGKTAFFDVLKLRLNGLQGTVSISPNPVRELLQLQVSCEEKGMITASVFNNSGTMVKQWILNKVDETFQQAISVADLQPGNYVLQIKLRNFTETLQFVRN
jgi:hypothetical protein